MYLLNQKSSSSHHRPQPEAGLISHQQSRLVYWLSGLGLLALFLFFAWPYLLENWDSGRTDQMYYLDLGLDIRQGIRLTDGNRHPLFPLLLSTFARSEWAYFTSAKLLNVGLTLVTLALLLWLNSRLFGLSVALLSVGLTIFSVDFLEVQTKTIAEPLLTLLFTLVFYFWYRGATTDRTRFILLAGALAGLSYLTKGTGQLLLLCFGLWAVLAGYGRRKPAGLLGFVGLYLLVALPLLIYNNYAWGSPLYNYNSATAIWYDDWEDIYRLPDSLGTAQAYFATHTGTDVAARFLAGGQLIIEKNWPVLLPPQTLILLGLGGLALVINRLQAKPPSTDVNNIASSTETLNKKWISSGWLIPVVVLGFWLIFFAWYAPVSSSNRHFVPLLPLVNTTVAIIFCVGIGNLGTGSRRRFAFVSAVGIIVLFAFGKRDVLQPGRFEALANGWNVYESDVRHNRELDELLQGLTANGPVTVINGPNQLLPLWRVRHYDLRVEEIPKEVDSAAAMAEFAASQEAQYLIVEALVIKRRTFLQNYFTLEDDDEDYTPFEMIQPLPSMTEMAYYKMGQTPIMILEPEGQP